MKISSSLLPFFSSCLLLCIMAQCLADTVNEQPVSAECKVALRIISSPDYIKDHHGEIPDDGKMSEQDLSNFVTHLFMESIKKSDDQEQFCTNTVRDNLTYTNAYHLPEKCMEFLPLLKKSFEERIAYKKETVKSVDMRMNGAIADMLILDEIAPDKLLSRCEVGLKVMQVNLHDKHLKEKYPLPPTCEVFFDQMEKSMILPAQLETIQRQRVIFAIENKDTPEKLVEICEEISK